MTAESLPTKLRRLAFLTEQGEVAPRYADRLAGEADRVLKLLERDRAVQRLGALMPRPSRWEAAGEVADTLARFYSGAAWSRIQRGGRQPRGELETLCVAVLTHGGSLCQRKVWEIMKQNVVKTSPVKFLGTGVSARSGK